MVALDLARAVAAIAVVAIHAVGYSLSRDAAGSSAAVLDQTLVICLRFARLAFMLLSGFALAYVYRNRPLRYPDFLGRRLWRTALPYAAWSLAYLAISHHFGLPVPPGAPLQSLLNALLLGTAFYHLYFVSVSLQWYIVFPPILAAARRLRGRGLWYAAAAVTAGYLGIISWLGAGAKLPAWAGSLQGLVPYSDRLLPSYLGYYLLGTLAGLHAETILAWLHRHLATVAVATGACACYLIRDFLAVGPGGFSSSVGVFRPALFADGLAMSALLLGLCSRIAAGSGRLRRCLEPIARHSYAIYLAHPLVLFLMEFYLLVRLPWNPALTPALTAAGVLVSLAGAWAAARVSTHLRRAPAAGQMQPARVAS